MNRFAPLAALLLASPAMARPTASLWIDNHFDGAVQVVVDGRALGTVRPREDALFPVPMGQHHVLVQSMNGFVFDAQVDWFSPHRVSELDVRAPLAPLTVRNTGPTPLFVEGALGGLWVEPGGSRTAQVPAGSVRLTASVKQDGRMFPIDHETVWVEPGRGGRTQFEHCPPPTRLVVSNLEPRAVRVVLDGRHVGELAPGASLALDVHPGLHDVDAWSTWGGIVFDSQVRVATGTDTRVDLFRARPPGPPPHHHGGPPQHDAHHGGPRPAHR
jgi:hypothetical protein